MSKRNMVSSPQYAKIRSLTVLFWFLKGVSI